MLVFCTLVEQTDGPPGFGFRVVGTAIATFTLPSLTFRRLDLLPFAEPAGVSWGTGAVRVDDTVYVYGAAAGSAYVARVAFTRRDDRTMAVLDRAVVGSACGARAR